MYPALTFRVTENEREAIRKSARAAGMSVSTFLRAAALGARIGALTKAERSELAEISLNLSNRWDLLSETARLLCVRSPREANVDTHEEVERHLADIADHIARLEPMFAEVIDRAGVPKLADAVAMEELCDQLRNVVSEFNQIANVLRKHVT